MPFPGQEPLLLRRQILVQSGISVVINSVLSVLFGLAVSHGRNALPLSGLGGMAFDFFPQTFMITFATATAVTLATRGQVRRGAFDGRAQRRCALRKALLRGLCFAIPATVLLAPLAGYVLAQTGIRELAPAPFLITKAAYGALLAVIVAPVAVLTGRDGPARGHKAGAASLSI